MLDDSGEDSSNTCVWVEFVTSLDCPTCFGTCMKHRIVDELLIFVKLDEEIEQLTLNFLDSLSFSVDFVDDHDGFDSTLDCFFEYIFGLCHWSFTSTDKVCTQKSNPKWSQTHRD